MKYCIKLIIKHPRLDSEKGLVTSTLCITYLPFENEWCEFFHPENPTDEDISNGILHILRFNAYEIKMDWCEKNRFTEKYINVEITDKLSGNPCGLRIEFGEGEWSLSHPIPIDE